MKKTLSLILSMLMLLSVFSALPLTAGAVIAGSASDAAIPQSEDTDDEVTILDATCIQRYLANLPNAAFEETAADADKDGEVTILDATAIQRWLAGLPTSAGIGDPM